MVRKVILSSIILAVILIAVFTGLFYSGKLSSENIAKFFPSQQTAVDSSPSSSGDTNPAASSASPSSSDQPEEGDKLGFLGSIKKSIVDFFSSQESAGNPSSSESAGSATSSVSPLYSLSPSELEVGKKLLASMDNYQRGVPDAYKEIPIFTSVKAENIWTFLPGLSGVFYTYASSSANIVAYYERRLSENWFRLFDQEVSAGVRHLQFIERVVSGTLVTDQKTERELSIIIRDQIPNRLPVDLILDPGVLVYFTFGNPNYFR